MSTSVTWADAGVGGSPPESIVSLPAEWMQNKEKKQVRQIIANRSILAIRIVLQYGQPLTLRFAATVFSSVQSRLIVRLKMD